jgi:hypothetical protein
VDTMRGFDAPSGRGEVDREIESCTWSTVDFFISYTAADEAWAEWVAFVLEEQNYSTRFQRWDFGSGQQFRP